MQTRLPELSARPTPPRIEWNQLAKLIEVIRRAFFALGRIPDILDGFEALLKPPWRSILGTGAQYAIYNRLLSAYRNVFKEQQEISKSKLRKLTNKRAELLVRQTLSPCCYAFQLIELFSSPSSQPG